jgi:hypothetical protein
MPNTINYATTYISQQATIDALFSAHSLANIFRKPNKVVDGKYVKIQKITFDSLVQGNYSRATGLSQKSFTLDWVQKELTQDKGDILAFEKTDSEEARADGVIGIYNKYSRDVAIPTSDKYVFAQIIAGAGTTSAVTPLTDSNINTSVLAAFAVLDEVRASDNALVLLATPKTLGLLRANALTKGLFNQGVWNGQIGTEVALFDNARIIKVPESHLGTKTGFVLCNADAVDFQVKTEGSVYRPDVPGFAGRMEHVEYSIYYDCWIIPGGEKAVYVHKIAA